ncbi:MAG: RNA polymerase sigma-70 factor [Bacteroidales bacterium]|nr:RNA polymerase sigma-70 factor [Bacteroidales bacterium]
MQNGRLRDMIPCGDEKQVKKIYLQQAPQLIAFARKFVDNFTAEDIVHDVFLKFYHQNSEKFNENGIKAYLFRMLRNACLDYLEHLKVEETYVSRIQSELKIEELRWYDLNEDILFNEKINAVYDEIERLPPQCKRIFIKAYLEEEKHARIAKDLNISVRTVETQVYKALKIIRDNLMPLLLSIFFVLL